MLHDHGPLLPCRLSVSVLRLPATRDEDPNGDDVRVLPSSSLGCSDQWLSSTLLPKLVSWGEVSDVNTEVTTLRLVAVDRYNSVYQTLKDRYAKTLVDVSLKCTAVSKSIPVLHSDLCNFKS